MKTRLYAILIGGTLLIITGLVLLFTSKNSNTKHNYANEVVVTPTVFVKLSQKNNINTSSWETFEDKKLKFTMKHPINVILDPRQTSEGRITAFVFAEDKDQLLPGKIPVLYIADTGKIGIDGFSAFRKGDCGTQCTVSYKDVSWVNINNAYGVKNPFSKDSLNYFLTDKNRTRSVVNFYVGGYTKDEKIVQAKVDIFEQMIKTIQFT